MDPLDSRCLFAAFRTVKKAKMEVIRKGGINGTLPRIDLPSEPKSRDEWLVRTLEAKETQIRPEGAFVVHGFRDKQKGFK